MTEKYGIRTPSLQELIDRETEGGGRVVRFVVDIMDDKIEGFKPSDRFAAAKEIFDRRFGRPFTASDAQPPLEGNADDAGATLAARIAAVLDAEDVDRSGEGS